MTTTTRTRGSNQKRQTEMRDAILGTLAAGPMTRHDIEVAIKGSSSGVRAALLRLVKSGQIRELAEKAKSACGWNGFAYELTGLDAEEAQLFAERERRRREALNAPIARHWQDIALFGEPRRAA